MSQQVHAEILAVKFAEAGNEATPVADFFSFAPALEFNLQVFT